VRAARLKITADQLEHACVLDLVRELAHQAVVIDPVEELLQVHVDHPALAPGHVQPGPVHCLMRISSRPKARSLPPRSQARRSVRALDEAPAESGARPPSVCRAPSPLCLSDLRRSVPCKFRASTIFALLPPYSASYPLPVRHASALPSASFRFAVAHDTLALRLICIVLSSFQRIIRHFFVQCVGSRTDSIPTVDQSDIRGLVTA
jgi:hypothetical protein